MEVTTIQKYMHTSPRKLRLVADAVRKMNPTTAVRILKITPKYAATDLKKALETVLANAKVAGMNLDNASFKKLEIDESIRMRRFHAGTRGRVKPFKRRMAHIKIVLSDEVKVVSPSQKSKVPPEARLARGGKSQKLNSEKEAETTKVISAPEVKEVKKETK